MIQVLRINWAMSDQSDGIGELIEELRKCSDFDIAWRERKVATLATVSGRIRPCNWSEAIPVHYARLAVHGDGQHVIEALIPAGCKAASSLERYSITVT